ncbi:MAG: hypothetical protein ABIT08_12070 [Bacteroidia bacterium]
MAVIASSLSCQITYKHPVNIDTYIPVLPTSVLQACATHDSADSFSPAVLHIFNTPIFRNTEISKV